MVSIFQHNSNATQKPTLWLASTEMKYTVTVYLSKCMLTLTTAYNTAGPPGPFNHCPTAQ